MKELKILHLYPREMNLYGDHGNVLTLVRRCQWRGISASVVEHEPSGKLPDSIDIIFGGGGQDSGQELVQADFVQSGEQIRGIIESGTPGLFICGMYQLLGEYFRTFDGELLRGINAIDMQTVGGKERMVGNIRIKSRKFGDIVGYENHSGRTELSRYVTPLGTVKLGAGNNGRDEREGILYKNCIGTYLHGPILPKNPQVADFLIKQALDEKYGGDHKLKKLDDRIEWAAHRVQANRPR